MSILEKLLKIWIKIMMTAIAVTGIVAGVFYLIALPFALHSLELVSILAILIGAPGCLIAGSMLLIETWDSKNVER